MRIIFGEYRMKILFMVYYLFAIIFVFLSSCIYEFWLEGRFFHAAGGTAQIFETTAEHWEYVYTVTIFSAIALIFPTILAYTIESKRLKTEREKLMLQAQLDEALTKLLSGFVSICSVCKKVHVEDKDRKKEGWSSIDAYISERTDLMFSHGYCPDCAAKARNEIKATDK